MRVVTPSLAHWPNLFETSVRIDDAVAQHRARVLAALTFVLGLLAALGAVLSSQLAPAPLDHRIPMVLVGTSMAYATAYLLARFAAGSLSVHVTIAAQLLTPLAIGLMGRMNPASTAAWLSIAVLTASVILGTRAVLGVGASTITGLIAVSVASHATPSDVAEATLFLATATAASFVYCRYRDHLELIRREELETKNRRLEALGATLELRVAARTAELNRSHEELQTALDSLEQSQAVLLQTGKMAAIGRLTAGFAHELSSPLGAVLASMCELKALCDELGTGEAETSITPEDRTAIVSDMTEAITTAQTATNRAVAFVRGIKAHTRGNAECARECVDVAHLVGEVLDLVGYSARAARARLTLQIPENTTILVSAAPERLSQAVANVVGNAIDAVGERGGGDVTVRVSDSGSEVCIEVHDDGPGIPAEHLPRVCEPLFTTKPHGKGTGLGLALARDIVEGELGGRVEVTSVPGDTIFTLHVPKSERN